MYSRLKAGVHPKKKNYFLVQTKGGDGYLKVNIALDSKWKEQFRVWHHNRWWLLITCHIPPFLCFALASTRAPLSALFFSENLQFCSIFWPFAGAWAHHKERRRLKPCQWRRNVHWHCEWDRKCWFCLTANNDSAHSWTRGPQAGVSSLIRSPLQFL